jgi:predicted AAA+ superfamily ATPase
MQRLLMGNLIKWKESPDKKPLILQGVRQCGKTYLLKEFGARYYDDVFYCKFDEDKTLAGFFEQNLNPSRIIKDMSVFRGKDIKPYTSLIIFDEVQSCGKALTSLKYFCEEAPGYHIIAAGSLLSVAIPKGTSFPVGKGEFLTLFPMNFYEFLLA